MSLKPAINDVIGTTEFDEILIVENLAREMAIMKFWQGKRAVVTGGSSGLGRQLAQVLVDRGARVLLVARDEERLQHVADVTQQADIERLAHKVEEQFGGVDFLCHAAGRSMRGEVLDTPIDDFRDLWELNFLSAVRLSQAFGESLASSRGHLVLIGSLASKVAPRYLGAYPTSKFPLAALSQQLRLELGPQGLHVLLTCPGPIARDQQTTRYAEVADGLPPVAQLPGGGAKLKMIDPQRLAEQILTACERRQPELVVPWKARLLFSLSQLSPRWGDWLLQKTTSS